MEPAAATPSAPTAPASAPTAPSVPSATPAPSVPAAPARAVAPGAGAAQRAARLATPRLSREMTTMRAMLRIYCRHHHGDAARNDDRLCDECGSLFDYARKRLAGCPYGPDKPTCANCQIHCYGPTQREQTRVMMRYAGPRMLLRHPYLSVMHVIDGKRPAPPKPKNTSDVRDASRRTCIRSD